MVGLTATMTKSFAIAKPVWVEVRIGLRVLRELQPYLWDLHRDTRPHTAKGSYKAQGAAVGWDADGLAELVRVGQD